MTSRHNVRRLSSCILTPAYKLGVPAALLTVAISSWHQQLNEEAFDLSILEVLTLVFILLLAYPCLRVKKVTAYSDHLVVGNYVTKAYVYYHEIEEIKGCVRGGRASVRLRLRTPCRYGRSVHFVLPSTGGGIESQPEFQLLEKKCPHLRVRVRSWWHGALYLKEPTIQP